MQKKNIKQKKTSKLKCLNLATCSSMSGKKKKKKSYNDSNYMLSIISRCFTFIEYEYYKGTNCFTLKNQQHKLKHKSWDEKITMISKMSI